VLLETTRHYVKLIAKKLAAGISAWSDCAPWLMAEYDPSLWAAWHEASRAKQCEIEEALRQDDAHRNRLDPAQASSEH
jgi:hypothetical protein